MPPAGEHQATLVAVKQEPKRINKWGREQEQLCFTFELKDGAKQKAWVNVPKEDGVYVMSPSSMLYEIASALLAKNPPAGMDTDNLIGLECRIQIDRYMGVDGKERTKIVGYRVAQQRRQQEVPF
jgi:hypothetical protein